MIIKKPNSKGEMELLQGSNSYSGYRNIDLNGIKQAEGPGVEGSILALRIDNPPGKKSSRIPKYGEQKDGY